MSSLVIATAALLFLAFVVKKTLKPATVRCSGRNRGFTLIELLIVVAIVGILATVFVPLLTGAGGMRGSQEAAEANAKSYYTRMFPEFTEVVVSCASSDSDGDGYITCSGRGMKRGTDSFSGMPPVLCGGGGIAAAQRGVTGCKPAVTMFPQQ